MGCKFGATVALHRAAWKAGHKQMCRKPSERKAGDQMFLKDLQKRGDLNGRLIVLVEPDGGDRWSVRVCVSRSEEEDMNFSVGSDKLYHIRPAKELTFSQSECGSLYNQGAHYFDIGDSVKTRAFMWRAFQATHDPWEDVENLLGVFQDKKETCLCRLVTVFALGKIDYPNDLEDSMESYRSAIAIADSAPENELERQTIWQWPEVVRPARDIFQ